MSTVISLMQRSNGAAQLHEQYRPRQWSDVVAQDRVLAQIDVLRKRGLAGRAYFIQGASGTGKTTIARLLATEVAEEFNIDECDASELTPAALRELERSLQTRGLGDKGGRAVLVNEVHGLRKDSVRQLLVMLERLPAHVLVVFTTTNDGAAMLFEDTEDCAPLLSRCIKLELARRDLAKPFAERARAVAQSEGLDGQPIERYVKLLQECRNNLRAAIQAIEAGAMMA